MVQEQRLLIFFIKNHSSLSFTQQRGSQLASPFNHFAVLALYPPYSLLLFTQYLTDSFATASSSPSQIFVPPISLSSFRFTKPSSFNTASYDRFEHNNAKQPRIHTGQKNTRL
ncbi:unnamed protein product [Vicia faba]|uniref:Uncharacterized protein n=1 Tax=Vicia faba TaxID=3906 RepID=A0AAV0Z5X1_VICFA|nr:unnamed protein product [Vicia faba]